MPIKVDNPHIEELHDLMRQAKDLEDSKDAEKIKELSVQIAEKRQLSDTFVRSKIIELENALSKNQEDYLTLVHSLESCKEPDKKIGKKETRELYSRSCKIYKETMELIDSIREMKKALREELKRE